MRENEKMMQSENINLKKRIKKEEKQHLQGIVSIPVYTLNDTTLDELAKLSELFEKAGISLSIDRYENDSSVVTYDMMRLRVNEVQYKKRMTRHAGRKANFVEKYDKYGACTVSELKDKLNGMTKTRIAEDLGCSRMTLYRIIKNITKLEPDGDMSIWHYTS